MCWTYPSSSTYVSLSLSVFREPFEYCSLSLWAFPYEVWSLLCYLWSLPNTCTLSPVQCSLFLLVLWLIPLSSIEFTSIWSSAYWCPFQSHGITNIDLTEVLLLRKSSWGPLYHQHMPWHSCSPISILATWLTAQSPYWKSMGWLSFLRVCLC